MQLNGRYINVFCDQQRTSLDIIRSGPSLFHSIGRSFNETNSNKHTSADQLYFLFPQKAGLQGLLAD